MYLCLCIMLCIVMFICYVSLCKYVVCKSYVNMFIASYKVLHGYTLIDLLGKTECFNKWNVSEVLNL